MRRGRAVLVMMVGGGTVLALTAMVWATATAPTPTGGTTVAVVGAAAAPAATAAGLVLVAGALALTIAGPVVARIAALAAGITGMGALAQVVGVALSPESALREPAAAATGVPDLGGDAVAHLPAWAAAAVLAVMVATSLAVVPAVPHWQTRRSRFDRGPATPAADARTRAMDDWDALGRGEDPTDEPGSLAPRRTT